MKINELTATEKQLLSTILNAKDPIKAMLIATSIITAFLTTEEKEKVDKMVAEYRQAQKQ